MTERSTWPCLSACPGTEGGTWLKTTVCSQTTNPRVRLLGLQGEDNLLLWRERVASTLNLAPGRHVPRRQTSCRPRAPMTSGRPGFYFKVYLCLLLCVWVFCLCLLCLLCKCTHCIHAWYLRKPGEGVGPPGTRVTDICEPPWMLGTESQYSTRTATAPSSSQNLAFVFFFSV